MTTAVGPKIDEEAITDDALEELVKLRLRCATYHHGRRCRRKVRHRVRVCCVACGRRLCLLVPALLGVGARPSALGSSMPLLFGMGDRDIADCAAVVTGQIDIYRGR
jgi:hypothetical protein